MKTWRDFPHWATEDESTVLILGDCLEVLPCLEADAIVTDPNYGIQADKAKAHSSIRDNTNWRAMGWDESRPPKVAFDLMLAFDQVAVWGGNYFADLLPASSGWLAWIKPEAETGFSLADMELCWTNQPFAARTKRLPRRDGNLHPTQKPIALMQWTLEFIEGGLICDPFAGSFTTAIACMRLGRRFIGIEREKQYYELGIERVRKELERYRLFEPPPAVRRQQELIA